MKKMTKRIMAIMLSLVMILGCVPSFTTVVEAATRKVYNKTPEVENNHGCIGVGTETVTTDDAGNWTSNNKVGIMVYPSNGYKLKEIYACPSGQTTRLTIQVTPIETNYYKLDPTGMKGDVDIYATFERDIKTIADALDTVEVGFPTSSENGWKSDNGVSAYLTSTSLAFYNKNSMVTYNNGKTTPLTKNADGNYENTDRQLTFVMTNGILTSIICEKEGFVGTYEPAVKTITVNYEQPKTVEELKSFKNTDTITVNANATSISPIEKLTTSGPLYSEVPDPDSLGYGLCITILEFGDEDKLNAIDSIYLRDINLGKPEKTLFDILGEASTINYAVAINGDTQIWVIEKFDFSKKLNITASLNANMKVEDAISSITDNLTDDRINRNYSITEEPFGDSLVDATLEAGKKYYLHGEITKVEDSAYYNQVSINDEILPNLYHTDPEKPYPAFNTIYNDDIEEYGFIFIYEFTVASNSSSGGGSKSYKAKDDKDTAEKISGSGKKGSTRTITPIEGKKVSSVIVKDKDGNKVDVTLNADGTYSFKQPASDVNIEVSYKNREITLNIGSTEASVDGEKSNLDVSPVVRNDRTMLPIRFVAENLGAKVEWNEKKPEYVAITRGDTKIEITLGSDVMLVNGKEVKLDSVAFAENDRTYLPVRAISEALNAIVEWNEERPMEVKIYER